MGPVPSYAFRCAPDVARIRFRSRILVLWSRLGKIGRILAQRTRIRILSEFWLGGPEFRFLVEFCLLSQTNYILPIQLVQVSVIIHNTHVQTCNAKQTCKSALDIHSGSVILSIKDNVVRESLSEVELVR